MEKLAVLGATALAALTLLSVAVGAQCTGDCNGDGRVTINELITGVNIASGEGALSSCPVFDADGSGTVTISELILAVNAALGTCPATPTPPPDTATATATETASATPIATDSPPPTATDTSTATASTTPSDTATATATDTAPPDTETPTATIEPTITASDTPAGTDTPTPVATDTAPPAATVTPTETASGTPTASFTSTAEEIATFTPTPSPTIGSGAVCGNGLLEIGETCVICAPDCQVQPCTAEAPTVAFVVDLVPPLGFAPTTTTVLVGYRSARMSIPGSGTATSVRQRVVAPPPIPQSFAPNDLDYAVRVLVSRNVPVGQIATITFDRCSGEPAPVLDDLACQVETCSQLGSPVPGCTCTVRTP